MKNPRISVILPTYNRAELLPKAIVSVLCQSFRDFELILVDDGSDDDTRGVAKRFPDPRLRYVRREKRGGVAAARNTGVQHATGELLAFQDSDDEWLLNKLARQVEILNAKNGAADMVVCGLLRVGKRGVRRYPMQWANGESRLPYSKVISPPIAYTQTWLVPRAEVVKVGGFDERLGIWDDWELLIRLAGKLRISVLDEPLVVSEAMPDSLSVVDPKWIEDMRIVLDTHARDLARYPAQLATLEYLFGRRLSLAGRQEESRVVFRRSIGRRPLRVRAWVLMLATYFGQGIVRRLVDAASER